jgi:serine/threonine-protein kinase
VACPDENELLELADGLLPPARRAEIVRHVDECARCRAALAGIARSDEVATVAEPAVASRSRPAAELLGEYLRADAPARELKISKFVAGIAAFAVCSTTLATLVGNTPLGDFAPRGAAIAAGMLAYQLGCIALLRRGWFRSWLPAVNATLEISFVVAMQLAATTALGAWSTSFPGAILLGALIVMSALRVEPRLCIAIGAIAAVELVALALATMHGDVTTARGYGVRAMFCVIAGIGSAILARYHIERSESALRAIREQDLFGKYLVHERIGVGGMGEVFRATYCPEGGFVRTVALKRMRTDLSADPRFAAYFRSEVQLGASLVHPNLVQLLDCGRFRGAFVVAMELVDGASLAAILKRVKEPLPVAAVAYIGAELATALDYVHHKRGPDGKPLGLVHCDVNPPNVLVSRLGEVKLADFGVAQATDSTARGFAGKVAYAAPEQISAGGIASPGSAGARSTPAGSAPLIDARTDLFGLGTTLREMLAAREDVPAGLAALVAELLAEDRERRPADAASVRARLIAVAAPYPEGEQQLARVVTQLTDRDRGRAS